MVKIDVRKEASRHRLWHAMPCFETHVIHFLSESLLHGSQESISKSFDIGKFCACKKLISSSGEVTCFMSQWVMSQLMSQTYKKLKIEWKAEKSKSWSLLGGWGCGGLLQLYGHVIWHHWCQTTLKSAIRREGNSFRQPNLVEVVYIASGVQAYNHVIEFYIWCHQTLKTQKLER